MPEPVVESSSSVISNSEVVSSSSETEPGSRDSGISSSSGTTAIEKRAVRSDNSMEPVRKGYRDLKGRHFDKQIPYRVMF
ncbi:hypothetical protein [uncultured Fibrobacter sp.]|uniref:hypothetical protein n=1 Tax=uncultured Fibrobacter sp. TaxID=261512 RepID=UPI00261F741B|nr:hypothetical protein [uncultured Fibrobacter sp.]